MTGELPPQTPTSSYQAPPAAPPPAAPPPAAMPPRPQRSSAWRWGCGIALAGCLLLVMFGALMLLLAAMGLTGGMTGLAAGGERIALIRVDGTIMAGGSSGFSLLGGAVAGADEIVQRIEDAVGDPDVKGILLRVNSPGGTAAACQEIYSAVRRARDARNGEFAVVASMADVAASGGYYVAAAADQIFADPATMTGSIGVIAMHRDMSGLFDKLGIESEAIKSGDLKDMLSPAAPLSEEARTIVRALVGEVHEQFMRAVIEGRGMEESVVRELADGRIYIGQQAKENGLVDELGGFQEALEAAGKLAGIKGKPRVEEYRAPSLLRWLLSGSSATLERPVLVSGGLLYDSLAAHLAMGTLGPAMAAPPSGAARPEALPGEM